MRSILSLATCVVMASCAAVPDFAPRPPPHAAQERTGDLSRSWEMVERPGATLFLQSWAPTQPPDHVVVIVHGLRSHGGRYRRWARRLVRDGAWVFAADLRGHGRSSGKRIWIEDFQVLVDDLSAVVAMVRERAPERPVVLYGHSIGGTVAAMFAEQHPEALAGLAVTAPALQLTRPPIVASATRIMAAVAPAFPLLGSVCDDLSEAPPGVRRVCADPLIYKGPGPARTAAALMEAIHVVWQDLERIRVPLLAIHGTADGLIAPQGTIVFAQRLGEGATLKLYPGAGHDLHRGPEGRQVRADVAAFIARVVSGHWPDPVSKLSTD